MFQMIAPQQEAIEFGPFRLDLKRRLLFKNGGLVDVHGQVMAVLIYLVERSGEIISKDELADAVWHGGAVPDNNIAQHVSLVRRTLEDVTRPFRYIATVHGRGYRFRTEEIAGVGAIRVAEGTEADPKAALAEQFYQNGRYFAAIRTEAALKSAIQLFERAIELDAANARPHAALAKAQLVLADYLYADPVIAFDSAQKHARQALTLDRDCADAHVVLGALAFYRRRNFAKAHEHFERARTVNPACEDLAILRTRAFVAELKFQEALSSTNEGLQSHPDSPLLRAQIGFIRYAQRNYDYAIAALEPVTHMDPVLTFPRYFSAVSCLFSGQVERARTELQRICEEEFLPIAGMQTNLRQHALAVLCFLEARSSNRQRARELIARLRAMSRTRYVSHYAIAICLAGLGRPERMFAELRLAVRNGDPWAAFLRVSPYFDEYRSDDRFRALAENYEGDGL